MLNITFYDTKPYDKTWFDRLNQNTFSIKYFETKLNQDTAILAKGSDAIIAFVNDTVNEPVIKKLSDMGVKIIAMRCAGYNNIDFKSAFEHKIAVVRVPAYSPYAVAEHAMALLLTLNRKIHRAYNHTREYNFSLNGLIGFDLFGKNVGVIGTGKIGKVFINICKGFGMNVLAYDAFPDPSLDVQYLPLEDVLKKSDVISLHCPLTKETHHMINEESLKLIKPSTIIINTSRGALIDAEALLKAVKQEKLAGAGLDVYEEESEFFFEDWSNKIIKDDILALLLAMPNIIVTSHQAFLTNEALENIAQTTLNNLKDFFDGKPLENEICYQCSFGKNSSTCDRKKNGRCF